MPAWVFKMGRVPLLPSAEMLHGSAGRKASRQVRSKGTTTLGLGG